MILSVNLVFHVFLLKKVYKITYIVKTGYMFAERSNQTKSITFLAILVTQILKLSDLLKIAKQKRYENKNTFSNLLI